MLHNLPYLFIALFLVAGLFYAYSLRGKSWAEVGAQWAPLASFLRKFTLPLLVLLVLPASYLALALGFPDLLQTLLGAVPGGLAASGAEIAAGQQASGFVPFAVIGSKLLTFCTAYAVLTLWPWVLQRFTHPAPTRWAKGPARGTACTPANSYSAAFLHLDPVEKFTVYQRLQLSIVIRAAASALFAALVV